MFRVSIKESSVAKLGSVCRRVYRIFSHAFFHHRSIYDEFEVCDLYKIEMKSSLVQIKFKWHWLNTERSLSFPSSFFIYQTCKE